MLSCGRALCAGSGFVMAWQVWRVISRCCGVGSGSARQGRCGIFRSGVSGHVALRIGALRSGRRGGLCWVIVWSGELGCGKAGLTRYGWRG